MSSTSDTEKAAHQCGMTAEQWLHAKNQATQARTRGKRATARADAKLARWGDVDGQIELFTDDGE